jgi:hypothetical protein
MLTLEAKMDKIFCIDNFFDKDGLRDIELQISTAGKEEDFIATSGPFPGKLISKFVDLKTSENIKWFEDCLQPTVEQKLYINSLSLAKLYYPWDVHTDFYRNHCTSADREPYYNFLIPLADCQSRTIIFDQWSTDSPNFSDYKNTHSKLETCVDQQFWQENLSMCWPEDRHYLNIKSDLPWQRRGQLIGFPSCYFHSSDSFHLRLAEPKVFVHIRTESDIQ